MAKSSLPISAATGSQQATQNPQDSVQANNLGGQQSSDVQPGTATSLLTSPTGISLRDTPVTTVNLTSTTATTIATPKPRHTSPVLVGFSILLFVIAIILFVAAAKPANNTTN